MFINNMTNHILSVRIVDSYDSDAVEYTEWCISAVDSKASEYMIDLIKYK